MSNWTLRAKMLSMISLVAAVGTALGLLGFLLAMGLKAQTQDLGVVKAGQLSDVGSLHAATLQMAADVQGMVVEALRHNADGVARWDALHAKDAAAAQSLVESLSAKEVSEDEKAALGELRSELKLADEGYAHAMGLIGRGDSEDAMVVRNTEMLPHVQRCEGLVEQMYGHERDEMRQQVEVASQRAGRAQILVVLLILCGTAAGPGSLWFVVQMESGLRDVVEELSQGATYVAEAASQVAHSSQRLAETATQSSAAIEESSAATHEINSLTAKNAQSAAAALQVLNDAVAKSGESGEAIAECVQAMHAISSSAEEIQKIIEVIDKIAFQTNILALNAAVEAARAGEQGLGFAVVADEVRTLAQRSAQAATETAALIERSIGLAHAGHSRSESLLEASSRCQAAFGAVGELVREIASACGEQKDGMGGIDQSMGQLSQATQDGAAHAEETAAAAEQLNSQSDALQHLSRVLEHMVQGGPVQEDAGGAMDGRSRQMGGPQMLYR